ncbi:D-glucuronyl C5-epimerase-like [Littorina saxatilis]|uniref:D-glucuronyl C5-epimerase-like n=1 Tax=Littorina saxatilis TaxID=31220 RepID=UPI0038B49993
MRLSQAVRLVGAVGIVSILVTACLWTSCSKNDGHLPREVPAVVSDFKTEFHNRGTNSIKSDSGGGGVRGGGWGKEGRVASLKYHEMDCVINGDYPVKCRREGPEVFMPLSFIQTYFEVFGKVETNDKYERLEFMHANSKVHPPRQSYSPSSVFMSFEFYHVEERDRVKCISAIEGVPFSTQWTPDGHFYPIQIAQYGLSHYSKHLVEGLPEVLVMEDGEEEDVADWARPDNRAHMRLTHDSNTDSNVVEFAASDSLRNPGLVMMADEKEDYVMTVDVLFTSNGSLTVTVETQSGQLFNIHFVLSSTLITMEGSDIFYGLGQQRGHWIHLARDIKIDLQKGLSLKYTKTRRTKSKMNFARIKDIAVRGQGRLDNLTLARSAHMDNFYAAADWMVRHQDDRGGWPIMVRRKLLEGVMELPPGWYSAMAQGQAMSLLVRAHLLTSDPQYLTAAVKAMKLFEISSEQGGVLAKFMGQYDWYEEYPTTPSSFVLNGFIYALLGLYDLKETANKDDSVVASKLYEAGMKSLKAMLLMFDTGSDTFYDLRHLTLGIEPNRARWDYHTTHINQLLQLVIIDDDPLFKTTAQRWMGYMKGKRARHN